MEVKQFDQDAVRVDDSGRVTLRNWKFLRKINKSVVHRIPGTIRTIQFLQTTNNDENLYPAIQRTSPGEEAKDQPTANPQTPQPETKGQVSTDAQYTQRRQRHRRLQLKPN